ncbi:UNVERIFIED_CONTAM: hypothetical protein GTU68_015494 [Idotea baltica]|nr:hypothetical protein [Idotea baltica]
MHCADQKGIVASVTDFLLKNNGNIISLGEHVDRDSGRFFMRVEWTITDFVIPRDKIGEYFASMIASRFDMSWRLHFRNNKPRIAILVSKYAHCFFDILNRWEAKEWKIEIPVIISNHDKFAYVAERHNIPYHVFPINKSNKSALEAEEIALLNHYQVDVVVLARYMQILSGDFIRQFPDRIINIHHSSLPAFAGAHPYESAYQRGVKIIGATSHYVTEDLDAGPIIAQDVIPISHSDSVVDMKRKGKDIEKNVLAQAIWAHINYKIISYNNRTVIFN